MEVRVCFVLFNVGGKNHVVVGTVFLDTERRWLFVIRFPSRLVRTITAGLSRVPRIWDT